MRHGLVVSFVFVFVATAGCGSNGAEPGQPADGGDGGGLDGGLDAARDGSDAAPAPKGEWLGGTRLRPIVYTNGAVERLEGLHDTKLDVDCYFRTLADGKSRCTPIQARTGRFAFTDASCTQMIYGETTACAPSVPTHYVLQSNVGNACPTVDVLELGSATTPSSVYVRNGNDCVPMNPDGYGFRTVARTMAPAEFVSATVTREARGSALTMTYFDADDGARAPRWIESTATKASCFETTTSDKKLRCVPGHIAYDQGDFSDAACTKSVGVLSAYSDECGTPPSAVRTSVPTTCGGVWKFFQPGAEVTGQDYRLSGSACVAQPSPQGTRWLPGAPIDESTFTEVTPRPGPETPLSLRWNFVDQTSHVGQSTLWDAVHQAPCQPTIADDGVLRCMPSATDLSYADPSCTVPVVTAYHQTGCDAAPAPKFGREVVPPSKACEPGRTRLRTVGAPTTLSAYYVKSGSSCLIASSPSSFDFYAVGAEVPSSEFTELSRTVK